MRKPRVSIKITITSLYEEYLKLNPENPLGYHVFNRRHNTGFTFNQIVEIGKLNDGERLRDIKLIPRVVQKQKNNKERYWKDYLKNN